MTGIVVLHSITVTEDIGGPEPRYKRVTLYLLSDGTVRWLGYDEDD